ncbi:hypothetical protein RhiJN_18412 [Ceratobasidium sp. AG-Ba]|nr:hypothetical protein RhiJN_18412 [Ceratobasidium sp. AG-Ba]
MTTQTPRSSARTRRPTERLTNYDRSNGWLNILSKSMGQRETPPTTDSQVAERAKRQAAIAAARGNATQPDPLPPLKRKANDSEDELGEGMDGDDYDYQAGPALLEFALDDLENEIDRIEWLHQAIEQSGATYNYRLDPDYEDEDKLRTALEEILAEGNRVGLNAPASINTTNRVRKGATHVLEPPTTGRSSRVKLICTDSSTMDRLPAKLTRTDQSTLTLDGTRVSPPSAKTAPSYRRPNPTTSRPNHTAASNSTTNNPVPVKKRAIVPAARIKALRKENTNAACPPAQRIVPQTPAQAARLPAPGDHSDVDMADPQGQQPDRTPTPPTDEELGDRQGGGTGEGSDDPVQGSEEAEETEELESAGSLTKRELAQLRRFPPEVRPLVKYITDQVRLSMVTKCPFPERLRPSPEDDYYLEEWMPDFWSQAHELLREDRPILAFQDRYIDYVRNLLPFTRNLVRKSADALVKAHFGLRRSDPNYFETATNLLHEENWVLSQPGNNEFCFQHQIISDTILETFFRSPKSIGHRHIEEFTPFVPLPMMAYACCIVRHSIASFLVDSGKAGDLNSSLNSDSWLVYMNMLEQHGNDHPGQLLRARIKITRDYLKSQTKPAPLVAPPMNVGEDCDVDLEDLEELRDMMGDDVPDVDEWEEVKAVYAKQRANASRPRRSGPQL